MKNIIRRLATKEEQSSLYTFIAHKMWNDNIKYSETIGKEEVLKGFDTFIKEALIELKEQIQGFFVVSELNDKCLLYSFSYLFVDLTTEDKFSETSSSILKVEENYKFVDDYDIIDLSIENKINQKCFSNKKPGRPSEPLEKNILKANRIYFNLKSNHTLNVDDECKKEKISKSTYYRVIKWLRNNTPLKFD